MSTWLDMADAIATRINSLQVVGDIPVFVDRQKSISTLVSTAVGKGTGACITILWHAASLNPDSDPLASAPSYTIRLYTRPVLRDDDTEAAKADDLVEAMLPALNNWHPDPDAHCNDRLYVSEVILLPDKVYLIYEFSLTGNTILPQPAYKLTP